MAGYDGEIRINTKIDVAEAQQELIKLQNHMNKTAQKIEDITKKMESLKDAKVEDTAKWQNLRKDIDATKERIRTLTEKAREMRNVQMPTEEYKEIQAHLQKTQSQFDKLLAKQEEMQALGQNSGKGWDKLQLKMEEIGRAIEEDKKDLRNLVDEGKAFSSQKGTDAYKAVKADLQSAREEMRRLKAEEKNLETAFHSDKTAGIDRLTGDLAKANADMEVTKLKAQQVADKLKGINGNGFKKLSQSAQKASGSMKKLAKSNAGAKKGFSSLTGSIKQMVLSMVVFTVMQKGIEFLKSGLQNLAVYSKEYNKSMSELTSSTSQLKNAFAVAFQPILNVVIPILSKLVDWISAAANAVSRFFAILGGKSTYTKAIKQNKDYAASLDKVGGSADKTKGSLAGFDELEVMQKNDSSSGGGGTDGADGSGFIEESVGDTSKFEAIKQALGEIVNIFKSGFAAGLGDWESRLTDIQQKTQMIKDALKNIFTDPAVVSGAATFAQALIYTLGVVVGSMASIGLTIAQNLIGGIALYLTENTDRIKQYLVNMFDIGTDIANLIGSFAESFAYVFEAFGSENGQKLTANLIGIFSSAFMGVSELCGRLIRDLLNIIIQPFVDNKEALRTALEGFLGTAATVCGTIKNTIDNTFNKLLEVYDEHIKPFFDSIATGLSELAGKFLEFWNTQVQPVMNSLAAKFDEVMSQHIQPLLNNIAALIGSIADALKVFWEQVLKPLIACESLTSITIPKNITMLGVGVFENCTSLKDITIEKHKNGLINGDIFDNTAWYNNQPDGVVYFENALYGYKGTMPENTSVTIKSGTTYIARSAFQGQKNLTGISFPKSLTYIGMCAFQSCTGVKEIIIPDTVTSIEQAAFRECTSLEKIKLPSNLTRISYDVFFMCSNLKEIEIPETVTAIYNYAFFQCTSLDSIYLSKNIEKIGPGAFAEMNGVKVIISEDNPYFMAENDIIYNKDKTELIVCLSTAEKVIIPDTVKTLSNGAFGSDNYLKEIVIPDSVTAIGNSVFAYCTSLQSISIPDTVTQFGGSMFCGCTAIKSIRLSENITSMGQLTFQGCENLVYVELPKSLYQIGDSAFMECLSLKSIKVPEGIKKIDIDAFCDCPALETVIIPDSVTVIGATILDGSNSEAVIYCSENSKARTYAINNSYLYDDIQNAPYVACVSGLNVSDITSSSAKLTWDKVDDAEGYVVYRYDSTTQAWTTVAETADLSYSVDGLCDGTEYLYSVNTYKTVNGNKVFGNIQMEVSFTTDQEEKAGEEASNNSGNTDGTGNTNESGNTDGTGNTSDSNETDEETDTEKTSLVKAKVKLSKTIYSYNGKAKKPAVNVTLNGKTLKKGTDYTVTYKNNKNIGTAKVTVKGVGKYKGSVSKNFKIKAKKGTTVTVGKYKYTFTGTATVAFAGIASDKTTKVTIGKSVEIGGKTFKVTAIADKALYNKTKVTSVTIGANVTSIGKEAFKNCKKLATITVKSTKLKTVGKNALKGIKSTAKIKVPKSKFTAYKKLFRNKGQSSEVKVKKS